ncbi:MAG: hypothetical protein SF002_00915 [Alphaproteobacteria bacterium]|nr:hypothetical protein [Alphaproteobacteria bacterium]
MWLDFSHPPIKEATFNEMRSLYPKRVSFDRTHREVLKRTQGKPYIGTLNFPFFESVGPCFIDDTGLTLKDSKYDSGVWRPIETENEFEVVQNWIGRQGSRVFIRSLLHATLAFDFNLKNPTANDYTNIGRAEHDAKQHRDLNAIEMLVKHTTKTIRDIKLFSDTRYICAVPCQSDKEFDLPRTIVNEVSSRLDMVDLTDHFKLARSKANIKELAASCKWEAWSAAMVRIEHDLSGCTKIILIDDKYQSGATLHYIASLLYAAGAQAVYGLCMVKTLRDDANK